MPGTGLCAWERNGKKERGGDSASGPTWRKVLQERQASGTQAPRKSSTEETLQGVAAWLRESLAGAVGPVGRVTRASLQSGQCLVP